MTRILVASIVVLALVLGGVVYAIGSLDDSAAPAAGSQSAAVING